MKSPARLPIRQQRLLYGLLAILGLTFWFILGFPFANSNESYAWVAQFNQFSFVDTLTKQIAQVANFRPLGIATAWLGYRVSGGSIVPQQIFNCVGAILAWLILFWAIQERKLFAWVSFVVTGAFFAGYIYLFHLHGVFYSPLLIFLAILLAVSLRGHGSPAWKLIALAALAALAALFHPYSLVLLIAFLLGYALENWRFLTRPQKGVAGLFIVASLILIRLLVPAQRFQLTAAVIQGFTASYQAVELNLVLSLVAWLLSLVTIGTLPVSARSRSVLMILVSVALPIFLGLHQPFLFVWLFVSFVKTILMDKRSISLLILATAGLPAVTATGSPTYAVPVLMVCSAVTPLGWSYLEQDLAWQNRVALGLAIVLLVITIPLKLGVHLPVISALVKPVLAEREKTAQLDQVIRWYTASSYSQSPLQLCQHADNPVESTNALDRTYRPPTSQVYLNAYLASIRTLGSSHAGGQLFVCFGGETISNADKILVVAGPYNGNATVFECAAAQTLSCGPQPNP